MLNPDSRSGSVEEDASNLMDLDPDVSAQSSASVEALKALYPGMLVAAELKHERDPVQALHTASGKVPRPKALCCAAPNSPK